MQPGKTWVLTHARMLYFLYDYAVQPIMSYSVQTYHHSPSSEQKEGKEKPQSLALVSFALQIVLQLTARGRAFVTSQRDLLEGGKWRSRGREVVREIDVQVVVHAQERMSR